MTKEARNQNDEDLKASSGSDIRSSFVIRHSSLGFKRYFRELSIACALLLVLLAMAVFAPNFYDVQPLLSRLTREAPALVVACGMALVIISRQIDISVGSQFAVCSVCAGLLAASGWSLPLVVAAALVIGSVLGAFNGALVAGLRLSSDV